MLSHPPDHRADDPGPAVTVIVLPPCGRSRMPGDSLLALAGDGVEVLDVAECEVSLALVRPGLRFSPVGAVVANLLAANSRSEVLILVQAGVRPPHVWIDGVRRRLRTDPQLGAIVARARAGGAGGAGSAAEAIRRAFHDDGCDALAVRRETFLAVRGFDESLLPGADLTSAFLRRLRPEGKVVVCETWPAAGDDSSRLSAGELLYRQYLAGRAEWSWRGVLRGLLWPLQGIRAAWTAGASAPRAGQAAPAAWLALAGVAARAIGRLVGGACGGRPAAFDSPMLLPSSESLVGPGSSRTPQASVIVPAKPSHTCLLLTLHALVRQEMDEPFEVLVGMEEGTPLAAAIQRRFPLVRLCPVPPNAEPGGARNAAIPLARGEYLAFTDADDLPERTWLRDMVRLVERNDGRPVRGWVTMHHQFSCVARACRCAEEGIVRPRRALVAPGLSGANMAMASRLLADPARRFTDRLYGAEEIELLANLPAQDRVVLLSPRPEVREMRYDLWGQSLRRMYKLGYGSGHLRRRRRLRGSTMARWPVLAPLLVPGRYLLTARRVLACGAAAMLDFLRLTPIILCMLVSYTAGFVRGAKDARCAGRTEDGP